MLSITAQIAAELKVRENQVAVAVELLDGGATVPFIARYRKEATGGLDDVQMRELEARLAAHGGKDAVALLLCRSGKRSVLAAQAAEAAGFRHVFNVQEGFEGERDAQQQRGHGDGWRYHQLPWVQD